MTQHYGFQKTNGLWRFSGMNKIVFFIVTMVFLAGAQVTRTITVTGTVQDSATGLPVAGALVLLFDTTALNFNQISNLLNNLGSITFDTTFSRADGKFSCNMNIAKGSVLLAYGVLTMGYRIMYSIYPILPFAKKVELGVIKIVKSDAGALDTLTVSGRVVDSLSGEGIGGALVAFSGMGALDTAGGNRVFTNTDGTFSRNIIISKLNSQSLVGYIVSQAGYAPKIGQKAATGKSVDLGTIRLSKANNAVLPERWSPSASGRPDGMSVYSLNGKLLYDGPVMALEKLTLHRSGAVMVTMKRNSVVVQSRKVCVAR